MGAVKNVGHNAVDEIMKNREQAPYRDLFDFADRVPSEAINKRVAESLIKAGAFDFSGYNRAQLLSVLRTGAGRRGPPKSTGTTCPGRCACSI